jgi:hypothetical protein
MARKKVAVSLRKPSQAPEVDAQPADVTKVMAMSDAVPTDVVARAVAAQPDASSVVAPAQPATIEEFVSGVAAALEQSASELRPSEVKELLRRAPAGYRELTVLLPEKLVAEVELHCNKYNLDLSPLVATALEFHLNQANAKKSKRRERVAAAARALLTELTHRARSLWEARRASLRVRAPEPSAS